MSCPGRCRHCAAPCARPGPLEAARPGPMEALPGPMRATPHCAAPCDAPVPNVVLTPHACRSNRHFPRPPLRAHARASVALKLTGCAVACPKIVSMLSRRGGRWERLCFRGTCKISIGGSLLLRLLEARGIGVRVGALRARFRLGVLPAGSG